MKANEKGPGENALPAPARDQAPHPDTSELVALAQAGDELAFSRLVQPHMRKIYHVALRITRNREDAEDASQQTLLKAFANVGQFHGASQFSTWLIRIAMNEALMTIRKRHSEDSHLCYDANPTGESTYLQDLCAGDSAQPEVLYVKSENRRLLREAIGGLRGTLRVVVCLLGLEEHQSKDAARILNLSQSAVKTRFLRARQELRECLGERI
ncbi:MAG TPA: sigma-70 family RNA polymerase sigma factor [Verrucomicrobiae bacterium]|nr:sigma-70 family RNA polymerase sigma factor [Verrucomicrobiae bacterium]